MKIFDILNASGCEYAVKSGNGESVVVLLFGYAPILKFPENCGEVDSYYFTSNAAYFKTREIKDRLREHGYEVSDCPGLDYKKFAVEIGFLEQGRNSLCYHWKYGSRFVMECFKVKGIYNKTEKSRVGLNCGACGKCADACPADALRSGFDINRCLRAKMNKIGVDSEEDSLKFGKKILGCDICQNVCPHNKKAGETSYSQRQKELFDLENLFLAALKGKKGMAEYAEEIGANFARPGRFLSMCINAMGNSGNPRYAVLLENADIPPALERDRKRAIAKLSGK